MTKPMPIQKTTWLCPHCLSEFSSHFEAELCANVPVVPERFEAGDVVYVPLDYDKKTLVRTTIRFSLDVVSEPHDGHQPLYALDDIIEAQPSIEIGLDKTLYDEIGGFTQRPARQNELLAPGEYWEEGDLYAPLD